LDVSERLTLEAAAANSLEAVDHIHRYRFAAELCAGGRVIDVCCGSGYGAGILREVCPVVVGIDNDVATIDMAQATVGREADVEFEAADAHEVLTRPLHEDFDAIVLLEGLEHLDEADDALRLLRQHADQQMKLVISIPNSAAFGEENPFHVSDFGYEDAVEICARFEQATLVYQFVAEGSLIRSAELGELDAHLVEVERGEPEYANHFMVCVNFDPEQADPTRTRMQLTAAPAHNRHMRNLELANVELRRVNARLARSRLGVADSAAASLLAKVERTTRELEGTRAQLEELLEAKRVEDEAEEWIQGLHAQIAQHQKVAQDMQATRIWRLGARYWRARDRVKSLLRLGRH
jgi:2-polyprenyl-3-methyl-5-hydroxy-6-metoxy-1,4-benzoquinol methylase